MFWNANKFSRKPSVEAETKVKADLRTEKEKKKEAGIFPPCDKAQSQTAELASALLDNANTGYQSHACFITHGRQVTILNV